MEAYCSQISVERSATVFVGAAIAVVAKMAEAIADANFMTNNVVMNLEEENVLRE